MTNPGNLIGNDPMTEQWIVSYASEPLNMKYYGPFNSLKEAKAWRASNIPDDKPYFIVNLTPPVELDK